MFLFQHGHQRAGRGQRSRHPLRDGRPHLPAGLRGLQLQLVGRTHDPAGQPDHTAHCILFGKKSLGRQSDIIRIRNRQAQVWVCLSVYFGVSKEGNQVKGLPLSYFSRRHPLI